MHSAFNLNLTCCCLSLATLHRGADTLAQCTPAPLNRWLSSVGGGLAGCGDSITSTGVEDAGGGGDVEMGDGDDARGEEEEEEEKAGGGGGELLR